MKLHKLHVQQLRACCKGERHAVTSVLPRVRRNAPGLANSASRNNDRLCFEDNEAPGLAPVAKRARDALAVF